MQKLFTAVLSFLPLIKVVKLDFTEKLVDKLSIRKVLLQSPCNFVHLLVIGNPPLRTHTRNTYTHLNGNGECEACAKDANDDCQREQIYCEL